MNRSRRFLLGCVLTLGMAPITACGGQPAADLTIERLEPPNPNLPSVPTLPPPPHPVQYSDNSYSVYGLRRRETVTMDTDVAVTGYISRIYQAPECPRGHTCPTPAAPHFWIADTRDESDNQKQLMIVGYAENQIAIDEAVELARRGRYEPPPAETGMLPIPTDLAVGNKVKINGRFARISGSGFNVSSGLIEYRGYETLEAVEAPPEPAAGRRRR